MGVALLPHDERRGKSRSGIVTLPAHPDGRSGEPGSRRARRRTGCGRRGPPSPPGRRDGHVERNNGAWRYEFYATWDLPNDDPDDVNRWIDAFADEFNTFRPHQALDGRTPAEYLQSLTAKETSPSHM